jgi:hypothetical protein
MKNVVAYYCYDDDVVVLAAGDDDDLSMDLGRLFDSLEVY